MHTGIGVERDGGSRGGVVGDGGPQTFHDSLHCGAHHVSACCACGQICQAGNNEVLTHVHAHTQNTQSFAKRIELVSYEDGTGVADDGAVHILSRVVGGGSQ